MFGEIKHVMRGERFDVLEELDWEKVKTCPWFGCTSPYMIRRIPNRVEKTVTMPAAKQSLISLILCFIFLR